MKKLIRLVICLGLMSIVLNVSAQAAQGVSKERVIVVFKDTIDRKIIESAGGTINRELHNIPAVSINVPSTAIEGLSKNSNIKVVESDLPVKVKAQVADWGMNDVQAQAAWNSGYTGKGIKVAVVDTGISLSHPDLLVAGGASFVSYTASYDDDNGHGTHVSGIIGARNNDIGVIGAAPDAQLYAVKVLDSNGNGYLSDVAAGIDWSITNSMHVVNLSLGTSSDSYTLHQIVDQAYNSGILVVAAAGNSGTANGSGDTVEYPAKYDSAIAVAAVDSSYNRASFSSTGPTVEVAAPGVSIYSTYLNNSYANMSGTSMATPYTAGVLALLKEQHPTLTNVELRALLDQNVMDLGTAGRDTLTGYGIIQAVSQTQPVQTTNQTVTSVTTDKSTYLRGETVTITAAVTDSGAGPLSGVAVNLTITTPSGSKMTGTGTTNANGVAVFKVSTNKRTKTGTYTVNVSSSLAGYSGSSSTAQYILQ